MVREGHEAELDFLVLAFLRQGLDQIDGGVAHRLVLAVGIHGARIIQHQDDLAVLERGNGDLGGGRNVDLVDAGDSHERGRQFRIDAGDDHAVLDVEDRGRGHPELLLGVIGAEQRLAHRDAFLVGQADGGRRGERAGVKRCLEAGLHDMGPGNVDGAATCNRQRNGRDAKCDRHIAADVRSETVRKGTQITLIEHGLTASSIRIL